MDENGVRKDREVRKDKEVSKDNKDELLNEDEKSAISFSQFIIICVVILLLCLLAILFAMYRNEAGKKKSAIEQANSYSELAEQNDTFTKKSTERRTVPTTSATTTTTTEATTTTISVNTVQTKIESAGELVTSKYHYKDVFEHKIFKDVLGIPTSEERIYVYSGVILVGYDLTKMKISVDNTKKKIIIQLPKPNVISHDIDLESFQEYDIKSNMFINVSTDDVMEVLEKQKHNKSMELLRNKEYIKDVEQNAKSVIKNILIGAQLLEEYELEYVEE